jgi:hypothetical protein
MYKKPGRGRGGGLREERWIGRGYAVVKGNVICRRTNTHIRLANSYADNCLAALEQYADRFAKRAFLQKMEGWRGEGFGEEGVEVRDGHREAILWSNVKSSVITQTQLSDLLVIMGT